MSDNKVELSGSEIEFLACRLTSGSTIDVRRAIDKLNERRRERAREIRAAVAAPTWNPTAGHPDAPPLTDHTTAGAGPFQFNVPNVHPTRELALRLAVESRELGETAAETVTAAEAFAKFLSGGDVR